MKRKPSAVVTVSPAQVLVFKVFNLGLHGLVVSRYLMFNALIEESLGHIGTNEAQAGFRLVAGGGDERLEAFEGNS